MQDLKQIKSYLMHILQKPANQDLLTDFPSMRDLHAHLDEYHDIASIAAKLAEIEEKVDNKRKLLGFKLEHVYSLVVHVHRMVKNADYLINHLDIPLVDEANKFFKLNQPAQVELFKEGIPKAIYDRIQNLSLVYLSGAPINPYGHALLLAQDEEERPVGYFHVATLYDRPAFLTPDNFQRYLHEQQQEVIEIQHIPNRHAPRGSNLCNFESVDVRLAKEKLDDLCRTPWFWGMLKHNCLSFAKTILKAGDYSCAELGGRNQAKKALNGRGYEGGLPLPRLRVRNVSPQFLLHENYKAHIADSTLEQAFIHKLKTEPILEINVEHIQDERSQHLSIAQKNGAFLRYVMHNTLQVHKWQQQLRAVNNEQSPDEKAAADILKLIKRMILQVDWKIRFGGEIVRFHRISRTMKVILMAVDCEAIYQGKTAMERLTLIRALVKTADEQKCLTRTPSVTAFYRHISREPEKLLEHQESSLGLVR